GILRKLSFHLHSLTFRLCERLNDCRDTSQRVLRKVRKIRIPMNQTAQQDLRDEEIVALCQKGQSEVFEVLVRKYMEKAFRIAFDFTHDVEEAKDLSQEAFLRAFSRIKQFDGRSSFYTWFYRLVVNICLDHTRRKGRVIWERLEKETDGNTETV